MFASFVQISFKKKKNSVFIFVKEPCVVNESPLLLYLRNREILLTWGQNPLCLLTWTKMKMYWGDESSCRRRLNEGKEGTAVCGTELKEGWAVSVVGWLASGREGGWAGQRRLSRQGLVSSWRWASCGEAHYVASAAGNASRAGERERECEARWNKG